MYAVLCMAVESVGRAKFIVKGLRVVSESKNCLHVCRCYAV